MARRDGFSAADCAAAGGVHRRTVQGWLRRGRAGISPYDAFAEAYDAASAAALAVRAELARAAAERSRLESEAMLAQSAD